MIRPMNKSELLESLYDLVAEVEFGDHFNKADKSHTDMLGNRVNAYFDNGCEVFGYYEKDTGELTGYIMTVVKRGLLSNDCEILEIGVKNQFRGKGYASELLKFVEAHHSKDQLHRIVVQTYAADFEVIHFYGKNGFVPISVISGTNGPLDEGTIVMRKSISDIKLK